MSTSSRERILARLRAAPATALPAPADLNRITAEALDGRPVTDPILALRSRMEAMHAEVREIAAAELPAVLAEICAAKVIRRLMIPAGGVELHPWAGSPSIERFDRPLETLKDDLFAGIDAGLTVADCAIADTGMLVMAASPQQPRTLSLVPPIHICLLDRRRLHPTLPAALAAEGWAGAMPSNLIFVSGPSKTADIQQTLAYGAHGPKELIVLILANGEAP